MTTSVLVIDDDPSTIQLLSAILRANKFEVRTAITGEDGLLAVKADHPDMVILDLMMAGMDGWQTCHAIRRLGNLPILILSARDEPSTVASILDAGADDYLVKPVPSAVLVAHLNKLRRRAGTFYRPLRDTAERNPITRPLAP